MGYVSLPEGIASVKHHQTISDELAASCSYDPVQDLKINPQVGLIESVVATRVFIPKIGEDEPILTSKKFQRGWFTLFKLFTTRSLKVHTTPFGAPLRDIEATLGVA